MSADRPHRLAPFRLALEHICGGCLRARPDRAFFKKRAPSVTCDNCGSVTHDVWKRGEGYADS